MSYQLKYSSYRGLRQKHFGEKAKGDRIVYTFVDSQIISKSFSTYVASICCTAYKISMIAMKAVSFLLVYTKW